jgi:hypothetical protein
MSSTSRMQKLLFCHCIVNREINESLLDTDGKQRIEQSYNYYIFIANKHGMFYQMCSFFEIKLDIISCLLDFKLVTQIGDITIINKLTTKALCSFESFN